MAALAVAGPMHGLTVCSPFCRILLECRGVRRVLGFGRGCGCCIVAAVLLCSVRRAALYVETPGVFCLLCFSVILSVWYGVWVSKFLGALFRRPQLSGL